MLNQVQNLPELESCKIAIIGLGYVGLPLALEIAKSRTDLAKNSSDENVIGFDINFERINFLKTKINIESENNKKVNIYFTNDEDILSKADIYIIAVPTPIDNAKRPDFNALENACAIVANAIKTRKKVKSKNNSNPIIVFESTVYPGATEEVCIPLLEEISNLLGNTNGGFFYGYSPERINPGDEDHQLTKVKKIVSGCNMEVAFWLEKFYGSFIKAGIHNARSIKVAEAAKVIENTQRDLNIALVNELAVICDLLKIDTSDVIDAASTKWNFHDFRPGLVGGHCIGIDPYYLTHKAEQIGYHPEVVLAGRRINDNMNKWVGQKIILELSRRNLLINKIEVLILGLTYKANCSDLRNSQVANLVEFLEDYNIKTCLVDNVADVKSAKELYSIELRKEIPKKKKFACVVLAVSHAQFLSFNKLFWESLIVKDGFYFDLCNAIPRDLNPIRI